MKDRQEEKLMEMPKSESKSKDDNLQVEIAAEDGIGQEINSLEKNCDNSLPKKRGRRSKKFVSVQSCGEQNSGGCLEKQEINGEESLNKKELNTLEKKSTLERDEKSLSNKFSEKDDENKSEVFSYDNEDVSQDDNQNDSQNDSQRRDLVDQEDSYSEKAQIFEDKIQDQDEQKDYKGNSGKNYQNGNRNHNKNIDRQQQEAKYMAFAKSIKDMPEEDIRKMPLMELNNIARRFGIVGATLMRKDQLLDRIFYLRDNPEAEEEVIGVLEKLPDGFGFLRSASFDYISGPDDIYVSPSQIRRFGLRTGDTVSGTIRKPKEGEKYFALLKVNKINYNDPIYSGDRLSFDRLSPLHPDEKLRLENDPTVLSTRLIDIFSPIGKGQRGLLVAPPKVGKTVLLKEIALSLLANHKEVYLIVLLIDERPEEVTDMKRTIESERAEVISSTFDEAANRHVQVAEIVMEKAKRMVEAGIDVVILLDSITRLARAYNTVAPASGKVLTGGIDANALQRPKRFFGAARNLEGAGSLTIIATALVDTGSKMDEVIYEEFKGTGNMEMHMTRKLSNRRVYPALDILSSGTRRDDLLQEEITLNKVWVLQRFLSTLNAIEGMEFLIDKMKKFKTNIEFLENLNK